MITYINVQKLIKFKSITRQRLKLGDKTDLILVFKDNRLVNVTLEGYYNDNLWFEFHYNNYIIMKRNNDIYWKPLSNPLSTTAYAENYITYE